MLLAYVTDSHVLMMFGVFFAVAVVALFCFASLR
jgi:hypothetical protein